MRNFCHTRHARCANDFVKQFSALFEPNVLNALFKNNSLPPPFQRGNGRHFIKREQKNPISSKIGMGGLCSGCCESTESPVIENVEVKNPYILTSTGMKPSKPCTPHPKGFICAVCYDSDDDSELESTPCGHVFHQTCLRKWIVRRAVCPMCVRTIQVAD